MAKVITVPKNKEAEIALDYNLASPEQIVELNLTNIQLEKLWNDGIFHLIIKVSNSNIDDFEDEHITNLNDIYNTLSELKKNPNCSGDIIEMFELALSYKTSIHFYF